MQTITAEEYNKLCNNSLVISNDFVTLRIMTCTDKKVTFLMKRKVVDKRYGSVSYLRDQVFDFDFRYYEPYHGNEPNSGLYVFKTADQDSRDYPHTIERVRVYQGKIL